MKNEISVTQKLEGMMKELVSINMDTAKKVDRIEDTVIDLGKRTERLENDVQLTTQQRNTIRRVVHSQVLKILELPARKSDWTAEHYILSERYSSIFHARCYTEVSGYGHLAKPYGDTTQKDYIAAIKDIEAWTPRNGIDGLKREADLNRAARISVNQ